MSSEQREDLVHDALADAGAVLHVGLSGEGIGFGLDALRDLAQQSLGVGVEVGCSCQSFASPAKLVVGDAGHKAEALGVVLVEACGLVVGGAAAFHRECVGTAGIPRGIGGDAAQDIGLEAGWVDHANFRLRFLELRGGVQK